MNELILALLVLVQSVPAVETDDTKLAKELCRFYRLDYQDKQWRKQALPLLKREFLAYQFAYPIGYRQHWQPITSDRHLVDLIRRNGCPLARTRKRSLEWMLRYYKALNKIRYRD